MDTIDGICIQASDITADQLLQLARARGVEALDVPPRAGWRSSILLASIVDVRAPGVAERLVEMNASGELLALGMILGRIDMPELMPADRRALLDAGAFRHMGTRFDVLSVRGEDLLPVATAETL